MMISNEQKYGNEKMPKYMYSSSNRRSLVWLAVSHKIDFFSVARTSLRRRSPSARALRVDLDPLKKKATGS